jgi:hypothetical protein
MRKVGPAMEDFEFKVNLVAVVRVRADDESHARKVVPTVLGAPGTVEVRLANENNAVINAATGRHATITDVDFSIGSVEPSGASAKAAPNRARTAAPAHDAGLPNADWGTLANSTSPRALNGGRGG